MATIKCGFFNSINGDRRYTAEEMTRPYELLVSNGVFATQSGTPSDYLQVHADSGMNLIVKGGRGIFADKWFLLDGDMHMTVESAEVTLNRIDSIVVKVDLNESVRSASIIVKKGTPASTPMAPEVIRTALVQEYRLANIAVNAGVTAIQQLNITDTRGSDDCGWVTSLIQQVDTSTLYIQWQDAFDTWFKDVKETLSTSTLIRSYTSVYNTSVQDEKVIPINISQFNHNLDILQVYINGLMLIKDVEYTNGNDENITLKDAVDKGTPVSFVVYKSVDGSEAETVVQQVYELQNIVDVTKVTSDTGSTKWTVPAGASALTSFIQQGRGFHTFYAPASALDMPVAVTCRMFGHLTAQTTGSEAGWLIAMASTGSVYANYLNNGTWKGWRELTNSTQITNDTGGVKQSIVSGDLLTSFKALGKGFHTMLASGNVTNMPKSGQYFRCFGHITDVPYGWIIAIDSEGSTFVNFATGETTWTGWRTLYDATPAPLYKSENGVFPNENVEIIPTKALSQCQHGWQLIFTGYDDDTKTGRDYYTQVVSIPKRSYKGVAWNGESMSFTLLASYAQTTEAMTLVAKVFYVYDGKLVSGESNAMGTSRKMVLRAIYEY